VRAQTHGTSASRAAQTLIPQLARRRRKEKKKKRGLQEDMVAEQAYKKRVKSTLYSQEKLERKEVGQVVNLD
jgi:hypothetical protein